MTPTDAELLAALPGATAIRRRPCEFATSCPLTELTVEGADGTTERMLLKELVRQPHRPDFLHEPQREIRAYRDILAPERIGAALYAYGDDWLVIELVDGVELWQVGEPERWEAVAAWLGRMHARFTGHEDQLHAANPYLLDGAIVTTWLDRALDRIDGLLDAGACYEALAELGALPRTLVHGEFYPSNVLLCGERVVPVDWEMAMVGPGLLDLAALITGWSERVQDRLVSAYGGADPVALDRARLALALQWIGWDSGWTPPAEHRHDWPGEAAAAAKRLGLCPSAI
jgi:aminoglycoside phosphotransferase (APT) family kinase protein